MQKKMDEKGNLYDVDFQIGEKVIEILRWSTTTFEVKLSNEKGTENKVEKFLAKFDKKDKLGGYVVPPDERKSRKIDFVQKRMKPIDSDCSGQDYEESKKAIYKEMFNEEL